MNFRSSEFSENRSRVAERHNVPPLCKRMVFAVPCGPAGGVWIPFAAALPVGVFSPLNVRFLRGPVGFARSANLFPIGIPSSVHDFTKNRVALSSVDPL